MVNLNNTLYVTLTHDHQLLFPFENYNTRSFLCVGLSQLLQFVATLVVNQRLQYRFRAPCTKHKTSLMCV